MKVKLTVSVPQISTRLEQARQKARLTYSDLGQKAGVTHTTAHNVCATDKAHELETVLAIAKALGVNVRQEIFEKVEELLSEKPVD